MATVDWTAWARDLAADYADIAMIARFEPRGGAAAPHVCLVMKDGAQTSWFAAGKGIDGVAWTDVPGRAALPRLLADERVQRPGLRVYANFCDVRALMFRYDGGDEYLAVDDLVDAPWRMLYPLGSDRPSLEEFYLQWGEPEPS
jgi:hypothetical protein